MSGPVNQTVQRERTNDQTDAQQHPFHRLAAHVSEYRHVDAVERIGQIAEPAAELPGRELPRGGQPDDQRHHEEHAHQIERDPVDAGDDDQRRKRKQENPPEELESERRVYADLAASEPLIELVDASKPADAVRADVTAIVWDKVAARWARGRTGCEPAGR